MSGSVKIKEKYFEGIDFTQRVNNFTLKPSPDNSLIPLFEAISNSIHSIEEAQESSGEVVIYINRTEYAQLLLEEGGATERAKKPIIDFSIKDNGVGFDNNHFNAFVTSDTSFKLKKGGKGIGRFSWVKAFSNASIESVFIDGDGKLSKRTFDFVYANDPIRNFRTGKAEATSRETIIRLQGYKKNFREKAPKSADTIARRIIEHFLFLFLKDKAPTITVIDTCYGDSIVLNDLFSSGIKADFETKKFSVKGEAFRLEHLKLYSPSEQPDHRIHLCGQDREVEQVSLPGKLNFLKSKTRIQESEDKAFIYMGYVSSPYLDENLNPARTGFEIYDKQAPSFFDELSKSEILDAVLLHVENFLKEYVEKTITQNKARIKKYIESHYKYRPLLEFMSERVYRIKPNLSDVELDIELHKLYSELELDFKQRQEQYVSQTSLGNSSFVEKRKKKYDEFLRMGNELGKYKLAEYVVHRKAILDLLRAKRGASDSGKYNLEKDIHEIFYPMQRTTNSAFWENRNLWIIDEKLSYHQYLASDKEMSSYDGIDVGSIDRPDIAIFDNNHIFSDSKSSHSSVVIIEFKRPMREGYKRGENPIEKAYDYSEKIREGKAKDTDGVYININPNTPVYSYIICDLTPTIRRWADTADLTEAPNNDGYFGYNSKFKVFVEIMSFNKLLQDAEKRNKVLFDQLSLNSPSLHD